ncbi:MAG: hypothetical protein FJX74_21810 [Armatimonadetes bacterium]|nr:hypothetical protein [Armatimonadota bacterium]
MPAPIAACVLQHEIGHNQMMADCCWRYHLARKEARDAGRRDLVESVDRQWDIWSREVAPFEDCEAYGVEVRCLEDAVAKLKEGDPLALEVCHRLQLAIGMKGRTCGDTAGKSVPGCPF